MKKNKINSGVFQKTKKRIFLSNMIGIYIFMVIFCIFLYFYFRSVTFKGADNAIRLELTNIIQMGVDEDISNPKEILSPQNMVYIYKDGIGKYYTNNHYFGSKYPDHTDDLHGKFKSYKIGQHFFREMNVSSGDYMIQIIRNIDGEINALYQIFYILIGFGIVALLITLLIAFILMRKALEPIEATWNNQVNFIQDASHELRTPVSVIQSKLEGLLRTPENSISDRVDDIALAMTETRRLNKMIKDMLSLTKEDSIIKINVSEFNLMELLEDLYESYIEFAEIEEKILTIENKTNSDVLYISTDKSKLRQLLVILLDNAFKYTEKGAKISIILDISQRDRYLIYINDTGIGIASEELPYIFDRFFRSDKVRAQDIEGSGIGLSIAKLLSQNISSELSVSSDLGIGSSFKIEIPKSKK